MASTSRHRSVRRSRARPRAAAAAARSVWSRALPHRPLKRTASTSASASASTASASAASASTSAARPVDELEHTGRPHLTTRDGVRSRGRLHEIDGRYYHDIVVVVALLLLGVVVVVAVVVVAGAACATALVHVHVEGVLGDVEHLEGEQHHRHAAAQLRDRCRRLGSARGVHQADELVGRGPRGHELQVEDDRLQQLELVDHPLAPGTPLWAELTPRGAELEAGQEAPARDEHGANEADREDEHERGDDLAQREDVEEGHVVVGAVHQALGPRRLQVEAIDDEEGGRGLDRLRPREPQLHDDRDGLEVRHHDGGRAHSPPHYGGVLVDEVGVRAQPTEEEERHAAERQGRVDRSLALGTLLGRVDAHDVRVAEGLARGDTYPAAREAARDAEAREDGGRRVVELVALHVEDVELLVARGGQCAAQRVVAHHEAREVRQTVERVTQTPAAARAAATHDQIVLGQHDSHHHAPCRVSRRARERT
eukprot:scaffold82646_cov47-Phaeocystis_antarctica.AAC.1